MRFTRRLGMAGALVASALLGGAIVGTTFANDREGANDGAALPQVGGAYCASFIESFATELGVTTDALATAGLSAFGATLDAAVAAGDLSEEHAAAIRDRLATTNGDVCALFGGTDQGDEEGRVHFGRGVLFAAAAEALGLDREELFDQLREAGSLEAIAEQQGLDYAEVKAGILASVQATLDTAVADGTISQERADAKIAKITSWLDEGGQVRGPGWSDRRHHGWDDHDGRGDRDGQDGHDGKNDHDGDRRGD